MRFSLHYKISEVFLQEFWLFFGGKTYHLELPLHNIIGFFSPITWVFSSCISSFIVRVQLLLDRNITMDGEHGKVALIREKV